MSPSVYTDWAPSLILFNQCSENVYELLLIYGPNAVRPRKQKHTFPKKTDWQCSYESGTLVVFRVRFISQRDPCALMLSDIWCFWVLISIFVSSDKKMEENQSVLVLICGCAFSRKQSVGSYFPMFLFAGFYCRSSHVKYSVRNSLDKHINFQLHL